MQGLLDSSCEGGIEPKGFISHGGGNLVITHKKQPLCKYLN